MWRLEQSTMITAGRIRRTAADDVSSGLAKDTAWPVVSTSNPSSAEMSSSRASTSAESDTDVYIRIWERRQKIGRMTAIRGPMFRRFNNLRNGFRSGRCLTPRGKQMTTTTARPFFL